MKEEGGQYVIGSYIHIHTHRYYKDADVKYVTQEINLVYFRDGVTDT